MSKNKKYNGLNGDPTKPVPNLAPDPDVVKDKLRLRNELDLIQKEVTELGFNPLKFAELDTKAQAVLEEMIRKYPEDKKLYAVENKTIKTVASDLVTQAIPGGKFIQAAKNLKQGYDIADGDYSSEGEKKIQMDYKKKLEKLATPKTEFKINPGDYSNVSFINKKYGGSLNYENMTYRKSKYKQFKFGDFLANSGKFMLNNLDAVQSGITGQDYYKPDFAGKNDDVWEGASNVNSKWVSSGTSMAANYFVPGSTTLTKGMAGAVNPQGEQAQNIPGLEQMGSQLMAGMKYGGKMCYKKGGPLASAHNPNLADQSFIDWYSKNTLEGQRGIPYNDPNIDYDYYSYYMDNKNNNLSNPTDHFPDTYKRPSHPTFSNESIYSTPENPGGYWTGRGKKEVHHSNGKFKMAHGGNLTHIPMSSGTHEQNPNGGVDLEGFKASVEGGETINQDQEYVYSNSLLIDPQIVSEFGLPGYLKGKTFATASKLIESKFPRSDRFDKAGKEKLMNRLTEAQEALKDHQDNLLMEDFQSRYEQKLKKLGGKLYKKYVSGGGLGDPKKKLDPLAPVQIDPYYFNTTDESTLIGDPVYGKPHPGFAAMQNLKNIKAEVDPEDYIAIPPDNNGDTPRSLNNSIPYMSQRSSVNSFERPGLKLQPLKEPVENMQPSFGERFNEFKNTVEGPSKQNLITGAQLAPVLFNTVEGIRKSDRLDPNKYQTKGRYKPFYYDPTEELSAINDSYSTGVEAVRGAVGGSGGNYLSNLSSMQGGKAKATAEVYNKKYNLDNQANAAAQAGNIGIEGNNNQSRFMVDDWNMRSLQAKRDALAKASYDLSKYADGKNQEEHWKEMANLYGPNFSKYIDEQVKKQVEEAKKEALEGKKYGGKLTKRYKK